MKIPSEQLFRIQSAAALCLDTAKAYKKAAEKAEEKELQKICEELGNNRHNLYLGFKNLLTEVGKDMDIIEGTTTGQLQLFWMEMEGSLSEDQKKVLVKEMLRSEGMISEKLDEIREGNQLPQEFENMVESLKKSMTEAQQKLKNI